MLNSCDGALQWGCRTWCRLGGTSPAWAWVRGL